MPVVPLHVLSVVEISKLYNLLYSAVFFCHYLANMFEKFAASDAKNAARSENTLNKDGKDVFTRAKEEAKETFGEEAITESPDLAKNCSSEIKEDTSKAGNDRGKLMFKIFNLYARSRIGQIA